MKVTDSLLSMAVLEMYSKLKEQLESRRYLHFSEQIGLFESMFPLKRCFQRSTEK